MLRVYWNADTEHVIPEAVKIACIVQCTAIESLTCSVFCYRFWDISAIYNPMFT